MQCMQGMQACRRGARVTCESAPSERIARRASTSLLIELSSRKLISDLMMPWRRLRAHSASGSVAPESASYIEEAPACSGGANDSSNSEDSSPGGTLLSRS